MDPDTALENMRKTSMKVVVGADQDKVVRLSEDDLLELAESVLALDKWLSKGGFLPSRWKKGR